MQSIDTSSRDAGGDATRSAFALLLLTSIHHVYGGYVYATPWRYHAVPISIMTVVVILGALALWRRRPSGLAGRIARIVFLLTTLAIPVISFGLFEGLYNHVVKNLLYFAGAPAAVLARLFPPPTYEMPNDMFFEITGVLQVVPAAFAAWSLYRILRPRQRSDSIMLQRGTAVASRDVTTIGGEVVAIPDGDRLVHLAVPPLRWLSCVRPAPAFVRAARRRARASGHSRGGGIPLNARGFAAVRGRPAVRRGCGCGQASPPGFRRRSIAAGAARSAGVVCDRPRHPAQCRPDTP